MSVNFPLGMQVRNTVTDEVACVVGHAMVALPLSASDYTLPYKVVLVVKSLTAGVIILAWPEDEVVSADNSDRVSLSKENDVYGNRRSIF